MKIMVVGDKSCVKDIAVSEGRVFAVKGFEVRILCFRKE